MISIFLPQFGVISEDSVQMSSFELGDFLFNPITLAVLSFMGTIALFIAVLFIIRTIYNRRGRSKVAFGMKVLLVRVPKETKKEDTEQTKSTQQVQEMISVMETIFSTLGSLTAERGLMAWLMGREDNFSFEIVAHRSKISFYIAMPNIQMLK